MPNNINYVSIGKGKVVLFLHGWGQNIDMMKPFIEELKSKYKCVVLDLPGFGKSAFNGSKNLTEYTKNIRRFLEEKKLLPSYIVGHSFGGKVAVEYCLNYNDIEKLIIIASPLLKPKRRIKYYYKIYKYKLMKKINKNNSLNLGSRDYKNCSIDMKRFFVSVVNTHFDNRLKEIKIPVLLMWGNKDKEVPVERAKKINKLIENSKLHIVNGGHFAYLDNLLFSRILLNKFLKGGIQ